MQVSSLNMRGLLIGLLVIVILISIHLQVVDGGGRELDCFTIFGQFWCLGRVWLVGWLVQKVLLGSLKFQL
ncbi:hypothetical protein DsansV1_C11g0107251 [Dioscorea sansibarensis]